MSFSMTTSVAAFAESEESTAEPNLSVAAEQTVKTLVFAPPEEARLVPAENPLAFVESQIQVGEVQAAEAVLEGIIREVELKQNRYHADLLYPVALLGDAKFASGDYEAAVDLYGRARHIARVSHGLFDEKQLPVVYREANAHRLLGDYASAGNREEYAYEVARRSLEEYDPELLNPLRRLAAFYLELGAPMAARTLYNRAVLIHEANGTAETQEAAEIYRALAATYRAERFPAQYVDPDALNEATTGPIGSIGNRDLQEQVIYINSFPAGEKALQRVATIAQSLHGKDSPEELEALLELADWHLLFNRTNSANTLYQHVYARLGDMGENPAERFAEPKLLWFPRPPNLRTPTSNPDRLEEGQVNLGYTVSSAGRVRSLKTLDVVGPRKMIFRVRKSMRIALFRPALEGGLPVTREAQVFSYRFPYLRENEPQADATVELTEDAQPAALDAASETESDETKSDETES